MKNIELLAPARDAECGKAAVLSGADAVYIGAPRFGARKAASNSIEEIETLCRLAHPYHAKVYATLNTLLYDEELEEARQLAFQLQEAGVDGIIFQDPALLTFGLKGMSFIASTQTFSNTAGKVKFWEETGVQRVILPRELSLKEIEEIRKQTSIELEFFVHGALCVSFSGQCYMSRCASGRSANRGECAQMCRHQYSLYDEKNNLLVADSHLLSLRDLNLSAHLGALMDAGICSFKIEGRLKDINYVRNITAYYRKKLDLILEGGKQYAKSSAGFCETGYSPDPSSTFSRGFTDYFLIKRQKNLPVLDTPKSIGEFVGEVSDVSSTAFRLYSDVMLNPGDGILFRGRYEVTGTRIERTEGKFNIPASMEGIGKGSKIYRNLNHLFIQQLQKSSDRRQIGLKVTIRAESRGLHAVLRDEQGIESIFQSIGDFPVAEQKMKTAESLRRSVQRSGDSIYKITDVCIEGEEMPFMPVSAMNDFRRRMLENHTAVRVSDLLKNRTAGIIKQKEYPESELGPGSNVINRESASFYRNRGVTRIDEAMETADAQSGQCLMRMKYCLKYELEMCERLQKNAKATTQTWLLADHVRRYRLRFHCQTCEMTVETE